MIRNFQRGDHKAIAEIFTAAVHEIASRDYTPEQCLAWADQEVNYEHWEKRCERKQPFVAVVDSEIAGFLELDPDGHIDCAYVNPKFQRKGIMTQLVEHAVEVSFSRGIDRVYVEASICAKPMFEKLGFRVLGENMVTIKGVELLNFRMDRMLNSPSTTTSTPYDAIAGRFHAIRTELRPKEAEYLALLLEGLPEGSTILDLGCGTGQPIAAHLVSLGHHVVGVDGSAAMLAFARKALPEQRWIHEKMQRVEFEERFDAAVCWDSLFHLPRGEYAGVIRKVHRWLKPGGRLMVSSGGMVNEVGGGFTDTMFGQEFFYDSLPPQPMVALIEETGFDVVLAEMCDLPDGDRDKGKWATVAAKRG